MWIFLNKLMCLKYIIIKFLLSFSYCVLSGNKLVFLKENKFWEMGVYLMDNIV